MEQNAESETVVDIVIITALPKERDAFLRHCPLATETKAKDRTWYRFSLEAATGMNYEVRLVSLPNMGNINSAIATDQAIAVWNPSQIILAGIAGGIQEGNKRYLGDVIIGEQVVYYEYGKQTQTGIQRRYQVYRPAKILVTAAKKLSQKPWGSLIKTVPPNLPHTPTVHFGVVASGEKVVTDVDLLSELRSDWSELIGVEMEGAGSAIAAYESGKSPGVLLAKGISDWANATKADDWQQYAAEASAVFVLELLRTAPFESKPHAQPVKLKSKSYSGKHKIIVCHRLVKDWPDLADYFEIPLHQRARFIVGREPQEIWEWLEQRNKLYALQDALIAINRSDLVSEFT
jgi:nucleoside phosphorylase